MTRDDENFLREFFRGLIDKALTPDDPRYVPLYSKEEDLSESDPVELLARGIEWTPEESVQLVSGFRGVGKSTELLRLRKRLQSSGYLVVLCDLEDYLSLSTPVDVTDFLIALAGAFSDALTKQNLLLCSPKDETYWSRFVQFLHRTEVDFPEVKLAGLKANLRGDPSFRRSLQKAMAGHLGALVEDVRQFFKECRDALGKHHEEAREIVFLVDSVEHIRGTSVNAGDVQHSVETLFTGHSEKLHIPYVHMLYTVPPFLKVLSPGVGSLYGPGGLCTLPAVKVFGRQPKREISEQGMNALERIVGARGDWRKLLGTREQLQKVISASGGHLRDLLRILAEITRRARRLPVSEEEIEDAINQIRTEFLPISDADAVWLARVAETHDACLENQSRLPELARFFDTHVVLCYRNGEEWYDVHPLVREIVFERAAALKRENADE